MLITKTITKKILESIIHESFSNFGSISTSYLLDSLKYLGFHYATNAGISITIEDLKTPKIKQKILKDTSQEVKSISLLWQEGNISDSERFQSIIDSWNVATESLKNRIIDYYHEYDPINNLYIMAFSGARGNMSQVRQLVGMRGLMSDQEGNIIDLPIQTNFREGLTSIDYIISSYGARKGIVDTALKTADSGYLTRRLIYIAQDLLIREINCKTTNGVLFILNKTTNSKQILGRVATSILQLSKSSFPIPMPQIPLDQKLLSSLKKKAPLLLNIRSPLSCNSSGSICQHCYGWDLAQSKMVSLGEAVGIIAAQSIGEPGTQLTMRTFHTGGIFTSEMLQQTRAPFSGRIFIPENVKSLKIRTNHGQLVSKLQQEISLSLVNWKGESKQIFLNIGCFLYLTSSGFIKEGDLIAESSTKSVIPGARRLKPIYTAFEGEIKFESLLVRYIQREQKPKVKVNQDDGLLWVTSGKIFSLSKEIFFKNLSKLNSQKSLGFSKIISPFQGYINFDNSLITLTNDERKLKIDLSVFYKKIKNCSLKINYSVKNYQYIDKYTIISFISAYQELNEEVHLIRKKESQFKTTYFAISESDVQRINLDQVNYFTNYPQIKKTLKSGAILSENALIASSGIFLKKNGLQFIFQKSFPVFLTHGAILNYKQGDFVFKNEVLASLVNYKLQTEDIVQGLPKIEEIIEARIPKAKSYLSMRPGILVNSQTNKELISTIISDNFIDYKYKKLEAEKSKTNKLYLKIEKQKKKKQIIQLIHSVFIKDTIISYNEKIWKVKPYCSEDYQDIKNYLPELTRPSDKKKRGPNSKLKEELKFNFAYKYQFIKNYGNQLVLWKQIKECASEFKNLKNGQLIVKTKENEYFFLEQLDVIKNYAVPLSSKISYNFGEFIDLAEPITDGSLDPHELLSAFFNYHFLLDGTMLGTIKSLHKFQLILVNSIQAIYHSQGVAISTKHIEIIVRQMTAKVVIKESGDTPLLPTELVRLSLVTEIYKSLKSMGQYFSYKSPKYEPLLLSTTNSSLSKDGFLSAAGFQETKRVLIKAAIEGTPDWLRGLKECIIIGRLIPAGSSFLNYKNYLDNIYFFKNK